MSNAANVSVGKPKIGGGIYAAPLGTTLPTDTTTALNAAFVSLGYCSEDGLVKSVDRNTNDTGSWGGDVVLSNMASRKETWKTTFIESLDVNVLKTVHGSENVTGALSTGITVKSNSKEFENGMVIVAEIILNNGAAKRIVIPNATVSDVGDVIYKDDEAIAYETTFLAAPDASGNASYEYIKG